MKRTVYALGVPVLALALAGCWEQPRFDAGRSNWNSGESTITAANVADVEELWSTDTGDAVVMAPLSRSGAILAAAGDIDQLWYAVSLDADTGDVSWTTPLIDVTLPGRVSAPAYRDGHMLVPYGYGTRFGGTYELDPGSGDLLADHSAQYTISLAVADGDLATLSGSGGLDGFGATIWWRYAPALGTSIGGPQIGSDFAFVGDRIMWSFGTEAYGYSPACPPVAPGSPFCAPDWTHELGSTPVGVASAGGGNVVYTDGSGTVTVLNATTGAEVWTAELGAAAVGFPAVADGTILVGTADNRVVALSATDGTQLWDADLGGIPGAPVVGGNVVYVPVGSSIQAFGLDGCGAATCPALTTLTTSSPITGGPVVDDGRIVVGQNDGTITAFGLP